MDQEERSSERREQSRKQRKKQREKASSPSQVNHAPRLSVEGTACAADVHADEAGNSDEGLAQGDVEEWAGFGSGGEYELVEAECMRGVQEPCPIQQLLVTD